MASSPDYIRLATSSTRALAETALDSLRDAVVVVDARHKHFPVVFANAAAHRCLIEEPDIVGLIESPLHYWLTAESAAMLETSLSVLSDGRPPTSRKLAWRCAAGEILVMTDIKPLATDPAQRLIMLTFALAPHDVVDAAGSEPGSAYAADVLVRVDADLKVRFINQSAAGMSIEQIIGREIGVLLPKAARAQVVDRLRHVLDTGEPATHEFESTEADAARYFEIRAMLVRDAAIGTGISISIRDITERKHLEQEILDVSGRERQSIGRDLHDGLGQELTGVALMLRGLVAQLQTRCPEAVDSVNEIVALVNRSIENTRAVAQGLLPVLTKTGGLAFALRALTSRSRDLYGLDVSFRAEVAPDMNLDEATASHLYRIAQEALTNASRHGHATLVDIHLKATGLRFLLSITDNGEGFHPPTSHYNGMGLNIMKYRAGMIGATFEMAPNEPRGTVVRVMGEQPQPVAGLQSARGN